MRKFWQKKYISKYTGKEIDDAVAKAGSALQNPMTAAGDLIVGGADGEPGRLGVGSSGQVLKVGASGPEWAADSVGMTNPMTTAGDMIAGSIGGAPYRLPKGTQGQVLTMGASFPEWAAASGGDQHLYWHSVSIVGSARVGTYSAFIIILNTTATAIDLDAFKSFMSANIGADIVTVSGYYSDGNKQFEAVKCKFLNDSLINLYYYDNASLNSVQAYYTQMNVNDTVNQIF